MARISIPDSQRFFNRHLSWMQFNQRVLEEARDASNPLLERVKFLAITASNLDEFVEVRLAGLMQQAEHGNSEPGPDGRIPEKCSPSSPRKSTVSWTINTSAGATNSFRRWQLNRCVFSGGAICVPKRANTSRISTRGRSSRCSRP